MPWPTIVYNTLAEVWAPELMLATPTAKSDAIRFIYSLTPEKKTDVHVALETALDQDPSLEAILFLTDGEPTAGRIIDQDKIVKMITLKNAFRKISINPIGIDTRAAEHRFLNDLAQRNSGKLRIIR